MASRRALLAGVALVVLGMTSAASAASTSGDTAKKQRKTEAEAAPCARFAVRSHREQHAGRSLTEYLGAGAYRVTVCDDGGKPVKAVEAAPHIVGDRVVHLPRIVAEQVGAAVRVRYAQYPELSSPTAQQATEIRRSRRQVLPPADPTRVARGTSASMLAGGVSRSRGEIRPSGARSARDPACRDGTYSWSRARWEQATHAYMTNTGTFPAGEITRNAIIGGHLAWDTTRDSCGFADLGNVSTLWLGDTDARAALVDDGVSVVDFGPMSEVGCAGALACTITFSIGGTLIEADMRFNPELRWSHRRHRRGYDVQATATHESGHVLGFNDLYAGRNRWLTMYAYLYKGEARQRTLGRGDVRAMRRSYPHP